MKAKLTPSICYMAGLYSKASKKQKNFVSITTSIDALQERFVEIAVKDLEIEPNKILLGQVSEKSAGFYHSRVAKHLLDIANRETYLFKTANELARNYLAGIFDASGHISQTGVEIRHITPKDAMMLENLGIHSKGDRILNIGRFIALIDGSSIILMEKKQRKEFP